MNKPIIEASCVVDGVEYHAQTPTVDYRCTGCAAEARPLAFCCELGPCQAVERQDRSSVIWVRAQ
jgi:hypothetical protein